MSLPLLSQFQEDTDCEPDREKTRNEKEEEINPVVFTSLQTLVSSQSTFGASPAEREEKTTSVIDLHRQVQTGEIKKVNGEKEDIIYSSRWEQLVEDFYKNGDKAEFAPFDKFPLDKKIQSIKTIAEQVQEVENNMPETAHFLARLVRIFRTTTSSQLEEIHETLYAKADIYSETQCNIQNLANVHDILHLKNILFRFYWIG